jgi:hypothetical protein
VEKTFQVAPPTTQTVLTSSANPSVLSATVTFTATVKGSFGTPTGQVQWLIDGVASGVPVKLASGIAKLSFSKLSVTGSTPHQVTAQYLGSTTYQPSTASLAQNVRYARSGSCLGSPGHAILQPVNADGSSVFKAGSTVAVIFRVCDAHGNSVGTPGVVSSFQLAKTLAGTVKPSVNETVNATTPTTTFTWDATAKDWVLNLSTKTLATASTYTYGIGLNDGTNITFQFGLR